MTVYSALLVQPSRQVLSGRVLFLLSFVSYRLEKKFPPRSLMSVPETCACFRRSGLTPVCFWLCWKDEPEHGFPAGPLCGLTQLAIPGPRDPSSVFSGVNFLFALWAALTIWRQMMQWDSKDGD